MITCTLRFKEDNDDLYKIFLSESLESDRAVCRIENKEELVFNLEAKDPVSMRAFISTILKIVQTYQKTKDIK